MKKDKIKKPEGMVSKIIKTVLQVILALVLIAAIVESNTVMKSNSRMVNCMLGDGGTKIDNKNALAADGNYNPASYTKDEFAAAKADFAQSVRNEGIVLLKNEQALPLAQGTTLSFFGSNTAYDDVENNGLAVNETLKKFYEEQKGYGLGSGSVSFGDDEDFSINECPLSNILADQKVVDSLQGTTPVYVLKRVAGEGRDMPRSMYRHASNPEDRAKTYLEPDTTELEILSYLNDNFDNVVLIVNSNAAIELGWVAEFPNIKSVLYSPDAMQAVGEVLSGQVNPSGRTVDTFTADVLASPAAQNFGDYQYINEDGTLTKYNYVTYEEGIYVGYRYYETRFEDAELGQGNAGDYDYDKEVVYPFGYGLSYTDFDWEFKAGTWKDDKYTCAVKVTNTGDTAGKEVVELYAQSPYTDYDKENGIEKSAVELVAYEKTGILKPGDSEEVTLTFDKEQLKAYDANGAKTYIFDAGNYYITAAKNAHDATLKILEAKKNEAATADVDLYVAENKEADVTSYSKDSYSGAEITNLFDDAKGEATYLTRSDWTGTFPSHDGEVLADISTWGNEINGDDGASHLYGKTISAEDLAKLDAYVSGNPVDASKITADIVYGEQNGLKLIDMRGLDYDDPKWDLLLNELTADEIKYAISVSGYGIIGIDSIDMPFVCDADTAAGLIYGGSSLTGFFSRGANSMTLAQTWNKDFALESGRLIGEDAALGEADGWYAPSMNIHRCPFSGRNGEYYSEDGFLSGEVASRQVVGAASKGMFTYIKHFAFNDQENHRGDREGQFSIATWLNEQSAREIYLKPFEMCMKSGDIDLNYYEKKSDGSYEMASKPIRACQAVMTGFNRIGYIWTGGSYNLITGILRNEWDFDGAIITDNANTGVFMDCYQMIEAGADYKLTSVDASGRFDNWDPESPAMYTYAREAMHHMLYTVANSRAMTGIVPGSVVKNGMGAADKIVLGVTIVSSLLLALIVFQIIRRFRKKKER